VFTGYPSLAEGPGVEVPLSGGDRGIVETVRVMQKLVRDALADPAVKQAAVLAVRDVPRADATAYAKAIFDFTKQRFKYVPDLANAEEITSPSIHSRRILEKGSTYGDCDDYSVAQAAWLMSLGVPARFTTLASKKHGGAFDHVRVEAKLPTGWAPMESTIKRSVFGQTFPVIRSRSYEV
jgi:transglutaminase-like putative cysteine protease